MNLTSKRMLNGLAVCAGAFALTAAAQTTWVEDSFEELTVGDAIYIYRAEPYDSGQSTNFFWKSEEGDASKIVATEDQGGYELIRPIDGATTAKHLQLETEGTTLIRYLQLELTEDPEDNPALKEPVAVPFNADTNVYIDTMIKFTPSEDDPEIDDPNVKVAVFVNVNSNLVVYHKALDEGFQPMLTNSVFTAQQIDPEAWYRLTIQIGTPTVFGGLSACQVFLNQNALSHENGFDGEGQRSGNWFMLAADGGDLTQVSFQGTGAIDEFVVADEADLGGGTGIMLTLTWDEAVDSLIDVTQGGNPVARNAEIASGSTIDVEIADWYELNDVTGDNITFGGLTGSLVQDSTLVITAAVAECTATLVVTKLSGAIPPEMAGGYTGIDAEKLSTWALANTKTQDEVIANPDWLDDYLLNVAPDTDATLSITSIVVADGKVTVTVAADQGVNLGNRNGTLVLTGTDELGVAFAEIASEDFTITEDAATATVEIDIGTATFLKAMVK